MTFFTRFSLRCQNISTMFATFGIGIFESLRKPSQTHIIPISHYIAAFSRFSMDWFKGKFTELILHSSTISGWWFGTWILFFHVSIYWECHHPNWRTHIFQRRRSTTNQIFFAGVPAICSLNQSTEVLFSQQFLEFSRPIPAIFVLKGTCGFIHR